MSGQGVTNTPFMYLDDEIDLSDDSSLTDLSLDEDCERPSNPFSRLPTEIIQYIAYLLPGDSDLANFSSVCRFLAGKIIPSNSTVWRSLFKDIYDVPAERSSAELKWEYQTRSIILSHQVSFKDGEDEKESFWLEVVQTMILDSLGVSAKNRPASSKTLAHLRPALRGSEFLARPICGYPDEKSHSQMFCAVQLCLTSLALDPEMTVGCLRQDYSIVDVYSYGFEHEAAIYTLKNPSLRRFLHIRNFWQRHLLNPGEQTFHQSFENLLLCRRPRMLKKPSSSTSALRTSWLGYLSCIHPYPGNPEHLEERQSCADLESHWTAVEPMSLQVVPHSDPSNWPKLFGDILPILGKEAQPTYFRGIQKTYGSNDDASLYSIRGFTENLEQPPGDIPGWSRICFVIYDANRNNLPLIPRPADEDEVEIEVKDLWGPEEQWPPRDLEADFHWIYGYEGLLLPGGRLMLGRWLQMTDVSNTGPFIFWDVDDDEPEEILHLDDAQ